MCAHEYILANHIFNAGVRSIVSCFDGGKNLQYIFEENHRVGLRLCISVTVKSVADWVYMD